MKVENGKRKTEGGERKKTCGAGVAAQSRLSFAHCEL